MAKKKIALKKEALKAIQVSIYTHPDYSSIPDGDEGSIDSKVQEYLKSDCGFDTSVIKGHKTGNKDIDNNYPSPRGSGDGAGAPDVTIYNLFGNKEVDVIVEDKAKGASDSKESTIQQAITYTSNPKLPEPCRIVIGNHPDHNVEVRVLVNGKYRPLIINGNAVEGFIGKELVTLIYDNPNINDFVLTEYIEKPFTQKNFHNIINKLKTLYRQSPEIQNSDETSINFTVAIIALKMIAVKVGTSWASLKTVNDILEFLDRIVGENATDTNLRDKYTDVFKMRDKNDRVVFDFHELIESVNTREIEDHRENGITNTDYTSVIIKAHNIISGLPDEDIPIDLFGEVYECLASSKTKAVLGQFFTRRHIIRAIVRMFFSEDDIEAIVNDKKTVGDCCCGTGGFLTETFKYIKEYYISKNGDADDISDLANDIIIGYDIDASNIGRTRVNMTLAGDGFSDIKKSNTLTAPLSDKPKQNSAEIRKNINFIVTNVPYGKGDVAYTDANSEYEFMKTNNIKRLELNFVLKIIDMLKDGGRASIIVPEGLLEAPTLAPFREYLLERCQIETIISLPTSAFAPYTKWKTYVIFIKKRSTGLKSMDEVIAKNEQIWAYIVDNDGYANSDKRFRTGLTDEHGAYLHDELSSYMDDNGVTHSAIIEQHFEAKDVDTTEVWHNEWNEEIRGKKFGYISIHDIIKKQTVVYGSIKDKEVSNRLKAEADHQNLLSDEDYTYLTGSLEMGKRGYIKPKKQDMLNGDGTLHTGYESVLETLNIQYDAENGKFFDLDKERTIYALPLVPEKYFRNQQKEAITLDELTVKVSDIEAEISRMFGGVA